MISFFPQQLKLNQHSDHRDTFYGLPQYMYNQERTSSAAAVAGLANSLS
jgi:hypothetical protein